MQFSQKTPGGQSPRTLTLAGAPVAGTDEIQTLTFGGTWADSDALRLYFPGINEIAGGPADLVYSSTGATMAGNLQTALRALLGSANIAVTGTGPFTATFAAALGKMNLPMLRVDVKAALGTLAITEATPGVDASYRGAPIGTQIVDTTTGIQYTNTGTAQAPTWTKVGTQT